MSEQRFGFLSSSTDPAKLGATVSGFILAIGTFLVWGAAHLGIPLADSDVGTLATQLGAVASSLWIAFGAVRKLVVWIGGLLQRRG